MIRTALLALLLAQDDPVIRSTVVNVQVPVTVLDKKGNFLAGLTAEDFRLFDLGLPAKVQVDESARPISLVVAVQASSGTRGVLDTVRKASALFLPLVAGDTGEVAVITFDHRVEVLSPFTSDAAQLRTAFAKLKSGSAQHHLDDATMEAIRLLRTRGAERQKVVLLISESFDQGSAVTPTDVFTFAALDDVLIYGVRVKQNKPPPTPAKNPVPPEARLPMGGEIQTQTSDARVATVGGGVFQSLLATNELAAYSQATGARELTFTNQKSLESAIATIAKEVHSQYLLTFAPQDPTPGYHDLTVQVTALDLQVRARHGYWALK
jgi:VWFA-related protein